MLPWSRQLLLLFMPWVPCVCSCMPLDPAQARPQSPPCMRDVTPQHAVSIVQGRVLNSKRIEASQILDSPCSCLLYRPEVWTEMRNSCRWDPRDARLWERELSDEHAGSVAGKVGSATGSPGAWPAHRQGILWPSLQRSAQCPLLVRAATLAVCKLSWHCITRRGQPSAAVLPSVTRWTLPLCQACMDLKAMVGQVGH